MNTIKNIFGTVKSSCIPAQKLEYEAGVSNKNRIIFAFILLLYCVLVPRFLSHQNPTKEVKKGFLSYRHAIESIAKQYNVSPVLIAAVIKAESDFMPHVVSPVGARGLMQLMPATARSVNVTNLSDPVENIRAGAKYLKILLGSFRGNTRLAVAAYNAGPGAVKKHGSIPPYPETQRYVVKVMRNMQEYKKYF